MPNTNTEAPSKQWLAPPLRIKRDVSERPLIVKQCPMISEVAFPWSKAVEQGFTVTDGRLWSGRDEHRTLLLVSQV
jgi:hypothetical protein